MLDIILTILKFLGIGIGAILAIVLSLLILILFVPVRYRVAGENENKLQAEGKAYWLLHIVTYQLSYENEELKQVVRVFGVPVWKK